MNNTKLTLSIEPDLVTKAKEYALKHGTSVSKVFSDLMSQAIEKDITETDPFLEKIRKIEVSENIKALTGILKGKYPENMDYKDMKYEYLKEKYGL